MQYCAHKAEERRLQSYASAGHIIANHTHSHPDLRETDLTSYLDDIKQAHRLLKHFVNFRPWFRYPFLSEGDTREKRDGVRNALEEMNYQNGYVTVDTYDWYMDWLVQDAINSGKKVYFDKLRKVYIKVLAESIDFYDDLARRVLGRSPKHVLLLHENDLAAMFVKDLVEHLEKNGWTIISAEEAYTDPIADIEPDTFFLGQGRVAALAHLAGDPGPFRKWESEAALQQLFNESDVFE